MGAAPVPPSALSMVMKSGAVSLPRLLTAARNSPHPCFVADYRVETDRFSGDLTDMIYHIDEVVIVRDLRMTAIKKSLVEPRLFLSNKMCC
jgi:hypothetical protein